MFNFLKIFFFFADDYSYIPFFFYLYIAWRFLHFLLSYPTSTSIDSTPSSPSSHSPLSSSYPIHPHSEPSTLISSESPSSPPLRRSQRTNIGYLPSYLKDYICDTIYLSNVTDSCFTIPIAHVFLLVFTLFAHSQVFLNFVLLVIKPSSYSQACTHPGWVQATKDEIDSLLLNLTWEVVHFHKGEKHYLANRYIKLNNMQMVLLIDQRLN